MKTKVKDKNKFCKLFKFGDRTSPTTILCIVLSEDENFYVVRTAKRKFHINKQDVISIKDTDIEFQEDYERDNNDN